MPGRPLVDTINGSVLSNPKELHPGSAESTGAQSLVVFDPVRQAVIRIRLLRAACGGGLRGVVRG
ncbi:hypothetical protein ACFWBR_37565 [Streptomyces sp. NPDC060006]|uniref:hypothetical protein n=1 Tax=unclassified Streptomyces TaxID=2593676 RepID=UPI00367DB3E8